MGYSSWSVVFGEQPSAAKWNILGTNDASFNDGTGIANGVIGASKLATGANSSYIATSENTTSTSYTGLTTPQTVTVTIGANGLALVSISAQCSNNTTEVSVLASVALSGANTVAAADQYGFTHRQTTATAVCVVGNTFLLKGLAAGSTTFTMQFLTRANTGTFSLRNLSVVPL